MSARPLLPADEVVDDAARDVLDVATRSAEVLVVGLGSFWAKVRPTSVSTASTLRCWRSMPAHHVSR